MMLISGLNNRARYNDRPLTGNRMLLNSIAIQLFKYFNELCVIWPSWREFKQNTIRVSISHCQIYLGVAILGFALSCNGGGSTSQRGTDTPSVPAPTTVAVSYSSSSYQVTVTWTPPVGNVDGYDIEGCLQGQSFTKINDTLIPRNYSSAILTFSTVPPELSTFEFRMRSKEGNTYSAYSNTAAFAIPLNPPAFLLASAASDKLEITLTWSQSSSLATNIYVERTTADSNGQPTSAWTRLTELPAPSGNWTDSQVQESVIYRYRATNKSGSTSSESVLSGIQSIGPFAPTGLTGVAEAAAVNLSWVNHSTTATAIQITRSPVAAGGTTVLATLSSTTTSFRDSNLRPGQYTYQLGVTDGVRATQGGSVTASPLNPFGSPTLQSTSLAYVPAIVNSTILTPSGTWVSGYGASGNLSVYPPSVAAWNPWTLTDVALVGDRFLAADTQGTPHMVYGSTTSAAAFPSALVHAWFDGQGWSSEKITNYDGSGFGYDPLICLDSTGTPKVVASGGLGSQNWTSLRYFSRDGGTWNSEAIGAGLGDVAGWNAPLFGLDPAGQPHLMLTQNDSLLEVTRSNDGTWRSHSVTDADFTAPLNPGKCLWLDNNNAWFIFEKVAYTIPGYAQIRAKAKVAGVWQPSILLDSFDTFPIYDAAITPDGTRLAVTIVADRGPLVYLRTAFGWIGSSIPASALYNPLVRTGFDSSGRLHILLKSTQATDWHE